MEREGQDRKTCYDPVGNRTLAHDATGRTTSTYDDLDRASTVTNPDDKTVAYTYDELGRRATMAEPGGGSFTYAYDEAGRLDNLVNPSDERTTYTYNATGRVTETALANQTRSTYTYDDAGQLTGLTNLKSDDTVISSFDVAVQTPATPATLSKRHNPQYSRIRGRINRFLAPPPRKKHQSSWKSAAKTPSGEGARQELGR